MKRFVTLLISVLVVSCFGQSQPAIYLTQPFIGNGISQAQNNSQAQSAIGINGASLSNVVLNAVTNGDVRATTINAATTINGQFNQDSGNFSVFSQNQSTFSGGFLEFNADSDSGGASGGSISIHANANDINTTMQPLVISSTNADLNSGSLGEIDLIAGDVVNITGGSTGINLNTPNGFTSGNGAGITNVPASGLTGQVPLLSLTNAGTLWTNLNQFTKTNSGLLFTNKANLIGLQGTNNTMTASNNIVTAFNVTIGSITSVLTSANVTTNLKIAGVSQEEIDASSIKLFSTNGVQWSLVYTYTNDYWTNVATGFGIVTNGNGLTPQWNLRDASGNTLSFKPASSSPQGRWSVNLIPTNAPTGDWGRYSDFGSLGNAEAWKINNFVGYGSTILNGNIYTPGVFHFGGSGGIGPTPVENVHGFYTPEWDLQNATGDSDSTEWKGVGIIDGGGNSHFEQSDFIGDSGAIHDNDSNDDIINGNYYYGNFDLTIGVDGNGKNNFGFGSVVNNNFSGTFLSAEPSTGGVAATQNNQFRIKYSSGYYFDGGGAMRGNGQGLTNVLVDTITKTNFLLNTDFTNATTGSILVKVEARCNPTTTGNALVRLLIDPTASGVFSITNQFGLEADAIFTTAPHKWDSTTAILKSGAHYKIVDVSAEGLFTITNSYWQKLDGN